MARVLYFEWSYNDPYKTETAMVYGSSPALASRQGDSG